MHSAYPVLRVEMSIRTLFLVALLATQLLAGSPPTCPPTAGKCQPTKDLRCYCCGDSDSPDPCCCERSDQAPNPPDSVPPRPVDHKSGDWYLGHDRLGELLGGDGTDATLSLLFTMHPDHAGCFNKIFASAPTHAAIGVWLN